MSSRNVKGVEHLALGAAGEDAAATYLESQGYRIVERNWASKRLEIDLIVERRKEIVFVEVKTRAAETKGSPYDALTPSKCSKLVHAAALYLSATNLWERPCRFDFVAVTPLADEMRVEHVEHAFSVEDAPGAARFWQPF